MDGSNSARKENKNFDKEEEKNNTIYLHITLSCNIKKKTTGWMEGQLNEQNIGITAMLKNIASHWDFWEWRTVTTLYYSSYHMQTIPYLFPNENV